MSLAPRRTGNGLQLTTHNVREQFVKIKRIADVRVTEIIVRYNLGYIGHTHTHTR